MNENSSLRFVSIYFSKVCEHPQLQLITLKAPRLFILPVRMKKCLRPNNAAHYNHTDVQVEPYVSHVKYHVT